MKKFLLLFIILFACTEEKILAQPVIQWQKSFGGIGRDEANSIQRTLDSGYIVAGSSNSTNGDVTGNHGGYDYWVIKLNSSGVLEWKKSFGGSIDEEAYSIQQTLDSGYIVAGATFSTDGDVTGNHGIEDYWILKLNSSGILQWQRTFGGTSTESAYSIQQTSDSGYIIAGSTSSNDGDVTGNHQVGFNDYWIIKLNSLGVLQWEKTFGGTNGENAYAIQQTADDGYIVAGLAWSTNGDVTGNHGNRDYWIIKLNSSGMLQWKKALGGSYDEEAHSIQQTADGGYIVAGFSSNSNDGDVTGNHGGHDYWIVKLNSSGVLQWEKSLGGSGDEYAYSVQETMDGGYVVAGYSNSNNGDVTGNHGGYDYWIVKLNSSGVLQWEKSFGGSNDDKAYSIRQIPDSSYIVAGYSYSQDGDVMVNRGNSDYWVVHLGIVAPIASLASTSTTLCAGDSVLFTDNSSGVPTSWTWQFQGGSPSSSTVQNPRVAYSTPGTYSVTLKVTNANGSDSITKTNYITVNAKPVVSVSSDTAICAGQSVQLSAIGGITYHWSPSTGLNNSNISNPIASPPSTTTYTVTVSNAQGCSAKDSVIITVKPLPIIDAGSSVTMCSGDVAQQLTATGGMVYRWRPPNGLSDTTIANPTARPIITITYYVRGWNAQGCSAEDSVIVTVLPSPIANAGADESICVGDSTVLTASGGTSYLWNTGATTSSIKVKPTATSSYIVTVSNANSCSTRDTVKVTVNSVPIANAGVDASICSGSSVQLSASGGTTYRWSPSTGLSDTTISNPIASPSLTTKYIVTVTNAQGCSAKDSVIITVKASPIANAGNDVTICSGDSVQLHATGGISYHWNPSTGLSDTMISNPVAHPPVTTTYVVTVFNAQGCSTEDTIVVSVAPLPVITVSGDRAICKSDSTVLTASGGTGYVWSTGATTPSLTVKPTTTTKYIVAVTNGQGCSSRDTVTVTVGDAPLANAGADVQLCAGDSVQLHATGGTSYLWIPSTGLSDPNIATPIAKPLSTTHYKVIVTRNGCVAKDSDEVIVTVVPLPTANAGADVTICAGDSTQLTASGGTSYAWNPAEGLSDSKIANPKASPTHTMKYVVTVSNTNGCSTKDSVMVTVNSKPNVALSGKTSLCAGDSTTLTALGGSKYLWSTADTISSITVHPNTTTLYAVTVQAENCCSVKDSVLVVVHPIPLAHVGEDTTICSGEYVQLHASGGGTYLWSPSSGLNDATIPDPVASPSSTTSYVVTVTNSNGCSARDTVVVAILSPIISGRTDTVDCGIVSVGNSSTAKAILVNKNDATVRVSGAYFTPSNFIGTISTTFPHRVNPNDSLPISFSVHPTMDSLYEGVMHVIIDSPCTSEKRFVVKVQGSAFSLCFPSGVLAQRSVGDVVTIPMIMENINSLTDSGTILIRIHYTPQLLSVIDAPTTSLGKIKNYNNDRDHGELSFSVEKQKDISITTKEVASVQVRMLLALSNTGSITLDPPLIFYKGRTYAAQGCVEEFQLNTQCIDLGSLRQRSNVDIVAIYPNPSREFTTILVKTLKAQGARFEIIDMFGRIVEKRIVSLPQGEYHLTLFSKQFSSGIYFVRLVGETATTLKPFQREE